MKKIFLYTLIFFTFACNTKQKNTVGEAIDMPAMVVSKVDTNIELSYVADIQARNYVEIRARQHGMIEQILVDEGKMVQAGQTIFAMSKPEAESKLLAAKAMVHLAQAELRKAKLEVKRVQSLVENKVVTATDYDLAESELQIAQAKLEDAKAQLLQAETQMSYTQIKAPFTGYVNRFLLKVGSVVEQGSLLTTFTDNKEIYAYFHLTEKEYLANKQAIKAGEAGIPSLVRLQLADGSMYGQSGKVEAAESEFDERTGTIALRARFDNKDGLLKHESSGIIKIKSPLKGVMLIPQEAVLEIQDKYFVYALDAENKLSIRSVKVNSRLDNIFLINSGIKPGEKILSGGIQMAKEGLLVNPILDSKTK